MNPTIRILQLTFLAHSELGVSLKIKPALGKFVGCSRMLKTNVINLSSLCLQHYGHLGNLGIAMVINLGTPNPPIKSFAD